MATKNKKNNLIKYVLVTMLIVGSILSVLLEFDGVKGFFIDTIILIFGTFGTGFIVIVIASIYKIFIKKESSPEVIYLSEDELLEAFKKLIDKKEIVMQKYVEEELYEVFKYHKDVNYVFEVLEKSMKKRNSEKEIIVDDLFIFESVSEDDYSI